MRLQVRISLFLVTTLLFSQTLISAQISLPKLFGDSMVLQRGINIPVWGNSSPGALIIAKLGNRQVNTKANKDGNWQLKFPVFKAGGPYELEIIESGKPNSKIILKGILIGDVWVASGQSNMEWQVQQEKDAGKEIANADFPQIRFLVVKQDKQLKPQPDIRGGKWEICDSSNVRDWSAVAYHFARKIHIDEKVPVGIVQSTWGGTLVEAWTSRDMLLTSPITRSKTLSNDTLSFDQVNFLTDSLNWVRIWDIVYNPKNNADKIIPATEYNDADWAKVEMPNVIKDFGIGYYEGMVWLRKKVALPDSLDQKDLTINLGHPEMNYSLYFNGQEICKNVWYSDATHTYTIPKRLVQHGENTIAVRLAMLWGGGGLNLPAEDLYITSGSTKVSLAGKWLYKKDLEPAFPKILNYQYYPTVLFNGMINPLIPFGIRGFIWYQGEANSADAYNYRKLFPMLISDWRHRWKQGNLPFLFVQLANFMKTKPLPSESEWAELREAQTMTLSQPNTGMACIIDIGEANDIHPKNKQEVGRRLALIANKLVYKKECIASGPVYKSSRVEGNRIHLAFTNIGSGLSTRDGKDVKGFAIAGRDKQFYWAKATIDRNEIVVYSDEVAAPVAVRYAWADNPDCNLINSEGLPALPFRSDEWNGITQQLAGNIKANSEGQFQQSQQIAKLESPDKSIVLNVFLSAKGEIRYQIQKSGTNVINPSVLGIMMKNHDFGQGMKLVTVSKPGPIVENYQTRNAKKSNIHYQANQLIMSFVNDEAKEMDIIFRLSNDGVGFRYSFPWIKSSETIIRENSSFTFDKNARAWLQPMSEAKTGWEHCHPSYEEHYLQNIPVGTVSPLKSGWVYPALFQTNKIWVLITEAALDGTYCGTRLVNDTASAVYSTGFADPREVFTGGGYLPENNRPWFTPWRIITIGSLKTIVESTLGTDLAPKAITIDKDFIKPGKASWSWINSKDDMIVFDEQKKYIDFASSMNWQYCLIDANWDTQIGYEGIAELATYAKQKKVSLILWYNSAGDWNTVAYHPKNMLLTNKGREKEFSRLHQMGIKGVKIDFFGGDGRSMIQYYIDILNDASKYKLLVNFHGATLPRGWTKTYPHLITAEAIYGMEMVTFDHSAADQQANHCAMLPFTRNAFDPMDFTPMNLTGLTSSNCIRKTTPTFELALSVLFLSGIQHYAQSPEGMVQVPGEVKEFLKELPDNWDDVKFLDGYPGKYAVIARRTGNRWYIAGINGDTIENKISLDVSSFKKNRAILFTDGTKNVLFTRSALNTTGQRKFDITLKPNSGFVLVFD